MATTLANISIKDSSSWNTYLDLIYPVGSYYLSNSSTSPGGKFGGTWPSITGRFLYCNNGTATGGTNTVTLTVDQMPSHKHGAANCFYRTPGPPDMTQYVFADSANSTADTKPGRRQFLSTATGGGKAHNNMPAYQTCYCWYRTA